MDKRKINKQIDRIVWAIQGPIIVPPKYEDMEIPVNVKQSVTLGRFASLFKEEELSSEAEAMWNISCASLIAPIGYNWTNVYQYLMYRWLKEQGKPPLDFMKTQIELVKYEEESSLYELRSWLYKKSFEVVKTKRSKKIETLVVTRRWKDLL